MKDRCANRSADSGHAMPHLFTSSYNGVPCCSWCMKPKP